MFMSLWHPSTMNRVDCVTNKILGKLCVGSDACMHGQGLKIVASAWFLLRSFTPKEGSWHIRSSGRGPGFEDWCFLPKTTATPWTSLQGRSLHWVKTDNCSPGQHPRYNPLSRLVSCAVSTSLRKQSLSCDVLRGIRDKHRGQGSMFIVDMLGTAERLRRQVGSESSFLYTK